jgi:N-acetylglutamate synthase-like GNAT family acetyltransferase
MVTVRPARAEELPYLQQRLNETKHEKVMLSQTILHVVEQDGKVIGFLPARFFGWQLEPMVIFPEVRNKSTRRRACYLLAKATTDWIADRAKNKTGIYTYWFVTKNSFFAKLAKSWGCFRIYKRTQMFAKDC